MKLRLSRTFCRKGLGHDSLENLEMLCAYCHLAEHGQLSYTIPAARVCGNQ